MRVKIKVPSSLADIKLSQYQKFLRVTKDVEDENVINRRAVGVFCDLTDDIVKSITKKSFDDILSDIKKILAFDNDVNFQQTFNHNGKEYGFIPNFDKITLGEQIDIDEHIKDWQKMDKVMAVMFREIELKHKDKYTIKEYTSKEPNLDLSMDKVLGAVFFLTNLTNDLLSTIPNFIEHQLEVNPKYNSLVKNGDGIKQSMEYLREIFSNSMQLRN